MITIRKGPDRGHNRMGWLESYHTFSFASYFDRAHMGFHGLRVMNEDWFGPRGGFPDHPHDNMEIFTWVLDGELAHGDSIQNAKRVGPGILQHMSAGSGIVHSEVNPSPDKTVHLYQIWIKPAVRDTPPAYEDRDFRAQLAEGGVVLLASPDGRDGSVATKADASLAVAKLADGERIEHAIAPGRAAWIQVARGRMRVGGHELEAGDGAAVEDESSVAIEAVGDAEALLFDLA